MLPVCPEGGKISRMHTSALDLLTTISTVACVPLSQAIQGNSTVRYYPYIVYQLAAHKLNGSNADSPPPPQAPFPNPKIRPFHSFASGNHSSAPACFPVSGFVVILSTSRQNAGSADVLIDAWPLARSTAAPGGKYTASWIETSGMEIVAAKELHRSSGELKWDWLRKPSRGFATGARAKRLRARARGDMVSFRESGTVGKGDHQLDEGQSWPCYTKQTTLTPVHDQRKPLFALHPTRADSPLFAGC